MDILTIGEILIDLTQTGRDEKGIPQFAANPGGAPANLAVAAAKLGAQTAFIGKVGDDAFGRYLTEVLRENGVDASGVAVDETYPTTMAVVSVDARGERDFSFYRSANADVMLSAGDIPDAALRQAKVVHFGSVSLTADPSRAATLDAVRRAKGMGKTITYDPNYRANLWPDADTAVARMKAPLGLVDILKVSDEELPLLTGTADCAAGTAALAEQGVKLIFVTPGRKDRPCPRRAVHRRRHQRRGRHLLRRGPLQALQRGPRRPDARNARAHPGFRQQGRQHHHQPPRGHPRHADAGGGGRLKYRHSKARPRGAGGLCCVWFTGCVTRRTSGWTGSGRRCRAGG